MDEPAAHGTADRHAGAWRIVLAAVALSLLWPALQIGVYGSFDALLNVGVDGPARDLVTQDFPDVGLTDGVGHDGQLFYLVARHPLDPDAIGDATSAPAYRYRRILYPAVAAVAAPGGGRAVVVVFLLESLFGVALGAWALSRLPGGPWWLPLSMAVTPGVIAALSMSLSDGLAAGLALASIALAFERRWWPMVGALVLAALTRETTLIVAAGLALTPGLPRRLRVVTLALPGLALAVWSLWSAHLAGASAGAGSADQLSAPFIGWASPRVGPADLALGVATMALLVTAAWRARATHPALAVVLLLGFVLTACESELVTFNWVNSARPVAPLVPLALWCLVAVPAAVQPTKTVDSTAAAGMGP